MALNSSNNTSVNNNLVLPSDYIRALASFVRLHETKLADFTRRHPTPSSIPSWTTVLTLGIIASDSSTPVVRKAPLILRLDPHHLYFLLLKAEEAGVNGIGSLDVLIEGGPTRPMSINYGNSNLSIPGFNSNGGMLERDSDSMSFRSTFSAVSSFSLGSGWWGSSTPPTRDDSNVDVKYIYSSMTKLPALRLTPFSFTTSTTSQQPQISTLSKPVKDFQDCPPPDTAVPLYAFKNLSSLILEDLDPRAFLGWDILSSQLRSLEVKRSGIEDIGELICDAVVEDFERRKKGRGGVGEERKRRQGSSLEESIVEPILPATTTNESGTTPTSPSYYPVPPPSAWSRLIHLSLSSNSLTFIPSTPLLYLSALTSLDLSSNLLISVPTGLATLHSLRSLNLSDNMIDSLLGISKSLGNVQVINLSKNRIDNLSGLDRLLALERIDLRENRLNESLEISRLSRLPLVKEVYIESNPFSKLILEGGEENYRVKCFDYFSTEGNNDIKLDGSGPGLGERRALSVLQEAAGRKAKNAVLRRASNPSGTDHSRQKGSEEARTAGDAKVVGRRVVTAPHVSKSKSKQDSMDSPPLLPTSSNQPEASASQNLSTSPTLSPLKLPHRKRKPKRIVDLDSNSSPYPAAPSSTAASTQNGIGQEESNTDMNSGDNSDMTSSPNLEPISNRKLIGNNLIKISSTEGRNSGLTSSQHRRNEQSASLGPNSQKKQTRRERVSASTFEDPTSTNSNSEDLPNTSLNPSTTSNTTNGLSKENSAEAFRKRVEALRNEVGESWLSVLGEREAALLERKNQSDEQSSASDGKKVTESLQGEVEDNTIQVVKLVGARKGKKGKMKGG